MSRLPLLLPLLLLLVAGSSQGATPQPLQIYFIDVEGGQSTLLITPERETLLIDAGFPGEGGIRSLHGDPAKARDPNRIVAAMRDAGVERIDYLLVTHFHRDHMGGVPELAQLVPVGTYVDHGTAYPPERRASADALDVAAYDAYVQARSRGRHLQPKPGDRLALKGIDALVVSADRATLGTTLPGAGEKNASCPPAPLPASDPPGENPRSTGVLVSHGRFRFLDVGDLADRPLHDLVCPVSRLGSVDVYVVAHHGGADAAEPATMTALRPRVAVVNNAPRKGGQRPTLQMLRTTPGVDAWQLHVADGAGEDNAPPERIANVGDADGHWLKVTAHADGSFRVVNGRTGVAKDYGAR